MILSSLECRAFHTHGFHLVLNMLHNQPKRPLLSCIVQVLLHCIVITRVLKPYRKGKRLIPWSWGG